LSAPGAGDHQNRAPQARFFLPKDSAAIAETGNTSTEKAAKGCRKAAKLGSFPVKIGVSTESRLAAFCRSNG
jgi:hypothetical protein